ncbi:MarR family winged helix-turn-helix transcriptional regulator [Inhella gelatinilytica]|uniref:Winged helix-turn-helix transcriptional regulator n=1 Tax=Inhella gelatinilytica TaxID=2795030 RepID=A0A931ITZ2_9BURK|nr:MarR family winged helix-turn-helix transcriptional regulator [Inhella gelatinilytica]MBH9551486.1 winged helix-turn-helix transcriptional regulator [Inhella gelatinilytica]
MKAVPHGSETDTPERLLRQFRVVLRAVRAHFQAVEREVGIGGAQLWALAVIDQRPDLGVNELARALSIRQPNASSMVKLLHSAGYVETRRDAQDKRFVRLRATPEGQRLLMQAPGPAAGVLPAALKDLTPESARQLERSMGELIALLQADPALADEPLAQL